MCSHHTSICLTVHWQFVSEPLAVNALLRLDPEKLGNVAEHFHRTHLANAIK